MALFLRHHGQYEQYDVAGGVQGVKVLLLEEDLYGRVKFLELAHPTDTVQKVSGEAAHRFRDDHVDLPGHKAPIQWIVPKDHRKAIETTIEVQQNGRVVDQQVVSAITLLESLDVGLLTDDQKIESAMIEAIGSEYRDIWQTEGDILLSKARMKNGSDMSLWSISELIAFQRMMKEAQQEKAKKEKLSATKQSVQHMDESMLRSRISAFLDQHPEFCDSFM